jgi:hypothetical protein
MTQTATAQECFQIIAPVVPASTVSRAAFVTKSTQVWALDRSRSRLALNDHPNATIMGLGRLEVWLMETGNLGPVDLRLPCRNNWLVDKQQCGKSNARLGCYG